MHTFGEELHRLREAAGLSQRQLAEAMHYDRSLISLVENGRHSPSLEFAEAADAALAAAGALLALAPSACLTPDDEQRLRQAVRQPVRVDAAIVAGLGRVLAEQRHLEDRIGSGPLLAPATAQLAVIQDLLAEARGAVRAEVLDLAAQWAHFVAWLNASVGQIGEAHGWYDRGLVWATEAGSRDLVAEILGMKSHVAWMTGQVGAVIGLSRAARRDRSAYPGQLAISAAVEARGVAILGDGDACDRLLDEATVRADQAAADPDSSPPWLYYHSPAFWLLHRGLAVRYLGRTDPRRNEQAIDLFRTGLAGLPAEMSGANWAGEFYYQLALAHVQDHDLANAQHAASESAAIASASGTTRLAEQAERLLRRLARRRDPGSQ